MYDKEKEKGGFKSLNEDWSVRTGKKLFNFM